MMNCIIVGIGGFIGTVCRYLVGLLPLKSDHGFPVKTLLINVAGAFLISVISAFAAKNKSVPPQLVLMLKVGVCGGFTTFSTFAYESADLMQKGNIPAAFGYMAASMILGLAAVFAGQNLLH